MAKQLKVGDTVWVGNVAYEVVTICNDGVGCWMRRMGRAPFGSCYGERYFTLSDL